MMDHLRLQHGIKITSIAGTWFHSTAKNEAALERKQRRQQLEEKLPEVVVKRERINEEPNEGTGDSSGVRTSVDVRDPILLDDPAVRLRGGAVLKTPSGGYWKAMWVAHNAEYRVATPVIAINIEQWELHWPTESATQPLPTASATLPSGAGARSSGSMLGDNPPSNSSSPTKGPPVTKVTITEAARNWKPDMLADGARRHSWPIETTTKINLDDFTKFLDNRAMAEDTSMIYKQGVDYLMSIFVIDGPVHIVSILSTLYVEDVITDVLRLPLMNPSYSWTRKVVDSLSLLCELGSIECGRRRWDDEARHIKQLQGEWVTQLKKRFSKERKVGMMKRKQHDTAMLESMATVDELKAAVSAAMVDLAVIAEQVNKGGIESTPNVIRGANVCLAGIVYVNGFAGRSKEWETLKHAEVQEAITNKVPYITMKSHKTYSTYGAIGKFLAPGTWAAVEAFISIRAFGTEDLFFRSTSSSGRCRMSVLLRRFSSLYLTGKTPVKVNLLRKYYHSRIAADESMAMQFMARLDAHSEGVAKAVYVANSPEKDAQSSKHLIEVVLGGAVEWPAQSDIDRVSAEDVMVKFSRCDRDDGDDNVNGEGGDEGDGTDCTDDDVASGGSSPSTSKGTVGGTPSHRRRIEYDPQKARFKKHEVQPPNIVVHKPPTPMVQTTLTSPPGRRRLTDQEKEYLVGRAPRTSENIVIVPDVHTIEMIRTTGIAEFKLNESVTREGIRSFLRTAADRQRQEVHERLEKERRKAAKRDKDGKKKADKGDKKEKKSDDNKHGKHDGDDEAAKKQRVALNID
jgi:hypothetical protein